VLGDGGFERALDAAERLFLDELMKTADASEGLQAFLAKRPPAWLHR
jgi:cyclohexa-1,5-dienecarbonyl-CoA hydratase